MKYNRTSVNKSKLLTLLARHLTTTSTTMFFSRSILLTLTVGVLSSTSANKRIARLKHACLALGGATEVCEGAGHHSPPTSSSPSLNLDPLRQAVLTGDVKALSRLSQTLDINTVDPLDGRSLMHLAVQKEQVPMIYKLAKLGNQHIVWKHDLEGFTPMHTAANQGSCDLFYHLKRLGSDLEARDVTGMTALHHAAAKGWDQCVDALDHLGAQLDVKDNVGMTPMHHAAQGGHLQAVHKLEDLGGSIGARDHRGWQPIHSAAADGYSQIVQYLTLRGADVNAKDKAGNTPMHFSVSCKSSNICSVYTHHT